MKNALTYNFIMIWLLIFFSNLTFFNLLANDFFTIQRFVDKILINVEDDNYKLLKQIIASYKNEKLLITSNVS